MGAAWAKTESSPSGAVALGLFEHDSQPIRVAAWVSRFVTYTMGGLVFRSMANGSLHTFPGQAD